MHAPQAAAGRWRVDAAAGVTAACLLLASWCCDVVGAPRALAVFLLGGAAAVGLAPAVGRAGAALQKGVVGRDLLVIAAAVLAAVAHDVAGAAAVGLLYAVGEASASYAEERMLTALGRAPIPGARPPAAASVRAAGGELVPGLRLVGPVASLAAAFFAVAAPVLLEQPREVWLRRAAVLLLAAAVLPVAARAIMTVALAAAEARGVLVRDAPVLGRLARTRALVLDESAGPLLHRPEVTEVIPSTTALDAQVPLAAALGVAAALSRRADPTVADAIQRHVARMGFAPVEVEHVHALPGGGAAARVHGATVFVGTPELFRDRLGVPVDGIGRETHRLRAEGKRMVVLGDLRGAWLGIAVAPRPVAGALEAVRRAGVGKIAILAREPEDAEPSARQTGAQVHLARTPQERRRRIEALGPDVAVLTRAFQADPGALPPAAVSVRLGRLGAAEDRSGVALDSEDLSLLPWVLDLARRAHALLAQNVALAIALLAGLLAAAITGQVGVAVAALWATAGRVALAVNALRVAG